MSSVLTTGVIQDGIYHYTGQRRGGGYVEDPTFPKNYLHAAKSMGPGVYMTIIVGLGSHNRHFKYSPLSKSAWLAISSKFGIEVLPGNDGGKILVNMSDAREQKDALMTIAAGLVAYIGQSDPAYGGLYTPEMAQQDFCITLTEVFNIFIF